MHHTLLLKCLHNYNNNEYQSDMRHTAIENNEIHLAHCMFCNFPKPFLYCQQFHYKFFRQNNNLNHILFLDSQNLDDYVLY